MQVHICEKEVWGLMREEGRGWELSGVYPSCQYVTTCLCMDFNDWVDMFACVFVHGCACTYVRVVVFVWACVRMCA